MHLRRNVLPLLAVVMLSACGQKSAGEPSGQVVATVDGQEITAAELKLELGSDIGGQTLEAATNAALKSLVARKLLSQEAANRGLDKTPEAAMMKNRAQEAAMIELLRQALVKAQPDVSLQDAQAYITNNPELFDKRRLLSLDKLVVAQSPSEVTRQLEPLTSLAAVEALLSANNVGFVRTGTVLDTVTLAPQAAEKLAGLGVGEVLIFTAPNGGLEISQINAVRTEPLTGPDAVRIAQGILKQRAAEGVQGLMDQIVKDGQAKVKINPELVAKPAPAK